MKYLASVEIVPKGYERLFFLHSADVTADASNSILQLEFTEAFYEPVSNPKSFGDESRVVFFRTRAGTQKDLTVLALLKIRGMVIKVTQGLTSEFYLTEGLIQDDIDLLVEVSVIPTREYRFFHKLRTLIDKGLSTKELSDFIAPYHLAYKLESNETVDTKF